MFALFVFVAIFVCAFLGYYVSLILFVLIRAILLSIVFLHWSARGMRREGRAPKWWRAIVYFPFAVGRFLDWDSDHVLYASYGTFVGFRGNTYKAQKFESSHKE